MLTKEIKVIVEGHNTTEHDGGCAFMAPDCPDMVWALSSERVSRIKHDGNSQVAYDYLRNRFGGRKYEFGTELDFFDPKYQENQPLHHHLAHASAAYFSSGFSDSAILVIDGQGGYIQPGICASTSIWIGKDNELCAVEINTEDDIASQSLGHLYSAVSFYLGFGFLQEGKLMGLAPYGKNSDMTNFFNRYIKFHQDGVYEIHPKLIKALIYHSEAARKSFKLENSVPSNQTKEIMDDILHNLGTPRHSNEPINQHHMNLAWSVQNILERLVLGLAARAKTLTGSERLCYAGGTALNSVANGKLVESGIFNQHFFLPPAGDSGQALGRLFYRAYCQCNIPREYVLKTVYLGPEYDSEEVKEKLLKNRERITFNRLEEGDLISATAKLLADGKILGWWQSRSELGPRALGNRSILADPRPSNMRDFINFSIKHREWFRPLAPSIILEAIPDYFFPDTPSPFMLQVQQVKSEKRGKIPAVVHVDGTTRAQTVVHEDNPRYFDLIKIFSELTGVPMILNTSFNDSGEPIVETPGDAIKSFLNMNLDYLVLGDWLVTKK